MQTRCFLGSANSIFKYFWLGLSDKRPEREKWEKQLQPEVLSLICLQRIILLLTTVALAVAIPPTPNARRLPNPPLPPPGITFSHPGKTIRADISRREDFIPPPIVYTPLPLVYGPPTSPPPPPASVYGPPPQPSPIYAPPPAPLQPPSPPSPAY